MVDLRQNALQPLKSGVSKIDFPRADVLRFEIQQMDDAEVNAAHVVAVIVQQADAAFLKSAIDSQLFIQFPL